jgi:hypothetical protein
MCFKNFDELFSSKDYSTFVPEEVWLTNEHGADCFIRSNCDGEGLLKSRGGRKRWLFWQSQKEGIEIFANPN